MEEEPEAAKLQVPRLLLNGFEWHCWLRMLDATQSCLKLQDSCAVDDLDVDSSDLDDELIEALEEVLAGPPSMHFSPIAMSTHALHMNWWQNSPCQCPRAAKADGHWLKNAMHAAESMACVCDVFKGWDGTWVYKAYRGWSKQSRANLTV